MAIQFITSKMNVEVNRRPIKPERLVPRPKIVKKDAEGNIVTTMMRAKLRVGVNEEDGKTIMAMLNFPCPQCEHEGANPKCPICK